VVKARPGVTDVLLGAEQLDTAIQHVQFDGQNRNEAPVSVDVLVAGGTLPPNPAQVIESASMRALLQQARREYDLVVVDTPPLVLVPDAFALLAQADGVLVVSRLGRNRKDVAARLQDSLRGAGAPVVGVVANGVGRAYEHSYRYDSDYDGRAASLGQTTPDEPSAPSRDEGEPTPQAAPSPDDAEPTRQRDDPPQRHDAPIEEPPQIDFGGVPALPALVASNGHATHDEPPQVDLVDAPAFSPPPPPPVRANGYHAGEERPRGQGSVPPPSWSPPAQAQPPSASAGSRGLVGMLGLWPGRSRVRRRA
jgi:hypothetical protein